MIDEAARRRFWQKVDTTADCWLWTGTRTPAGYGSTRLASPRRIEGAHRVAWQLAHGPIPAGQWVLHRCDTPACVRVTHLFLGDHADNMADMAAKQRHWMRLQPERIAERRGIRNPRAKLTDEQVAAIRSDRTSRAVTLAARYGITDTYVHMIRRGASRASS